MQRLENYRAYEKRQIATVAARWKKQYERDGTWTRTASGDSRLVYDQLMALPRTATGDDVFTIVGNDSWIDLMRCSECDKARAVVSVLEDEECGVKVRLCRACIRRMVRLAR